jgi:uncharacterized ferritin-like protein (DUF455 family)
MSDYFARIAQALACDAPTQKCALVKALHQDVLQDRTVPDGDVQADAMQHSFSVPLPGRPARPLLVHPRDVPRRRLGTPAPKGITQFLESIDDIDAFADIAAFNLCEDSAIKQQLLETLETRRRLQLFADSLKVEIQDQRLRRKLQGPLTDDQIVDN